MSRSLPGRFPGSRGGRRKGLIRDIRGWSLTLSRRPGPLPRLGRYRKIRTRGSAMTPLAHRDLGPDERAAEMTDSEEAGHRSGADKPAKDAGHQEGADR